MTTDLWTFLAEAFLLLAAPGPTNTLLATSAAASGWVRSAPLLAAEAAGYVAAIAVLKGAVGPLIAQSPAAGTLLSGLVVLYLLYLAAKLWHRGGLDIGAAHPVPALDVLVTTLLNPKGIILAFTLLPPGFAHDGASLMLWGATLLLTVAASGGIWLAIGAFLKRSMAGSLGPCLVCRGGAVALTVLAGLISQRLVAMA